ncbi:hypothetical protein RhiirB3_494196 [Rhizophagus irregularis]|nr:hypothetical protein RhiirB3_494196 [Rhizophagus irregularis]
MFRNFLVQFKIIGEKVLGQVDYAIKMFDRHNRKEIFTNGFLFSLICSIQGFGFCDLEKNWVNDFDERIKDFKNGLMSNARNIATNSECVNEGHSDTFAWADNADSLLTQNAAPMSVYTKLGSCLLIVVGVLGLRELSV